MISLLKNKDSTSNTLKRKCKNLVLAEEHENEQYKALKTTADGDDKIPDHISKENPFLYQNHPYANQLCITNEENNISNPFQ